MARRALLIAAAATALAAATASLASPALRPTVTWASTPVLPGQAALLNIVGMSNATVIETSAGSTAPEWRPATVLGATAYGCSIVVPAHYAPGPFMVRARASASGGADAGPVFTVNRPSPWFAFGDAGASSTPGGWLRVVGEAISLAKDTPEAQRPKLRLTPIHGPGATATAAPGAPIEIVARDDPGGGGQGSKLTRWHAFFDLPAAIPNGTTFEVAISNAPGADDFVPMCTFIDEQTPCLGTWVVKEAHPVLTVHAGGAKVVTVDASKALPGMNSTAAVHAALAAAASNGGGVVFFPRGMYFIHGTIKVPLNTVVRGEGRDLVSIYFHEDNQTTAPHAYVTSTEPGPWGIEGVTLYVTSYANNIVVFQPGTANAFMRNCRIRYNSYFCLEPVTGQGSRGRNSAWPHSQGTAVLLAGTNLFVTDNDIFSSGDVVSSLNNGAVGATYMHIARNRFWNGGTTHWGISWKQCIYEDNRATGASTTAMGSNYPQYAHNDGEPHIQNIYHSNNTQNMVWGNDREMMTCDGGGGVYFGAATSSGANVTLASVASNPQPGGALCVLSGTSTGECRRIIGNAKAAQPCKPVLRSGLAVVPCASGLAGSGGFTLPSTDGLGLIHAVGTNLSVAMCCDSSCGGSSGLGGGSSRTFDCGAEPNAEPVILSYNDSWTGQYGTAKFEFGTPGTKSGTIRLAKSGKCLGVSHGSYKVQLIACSTPHASTQWLYSQAQQTYILQAAAKEDGQQAAQSQLGAGPLCLSAATSPSSLKKWRVDRPFPVDLDATSKVSIMPYIGQIAFNGNYYSDGGEVQFYAQALSIVACENKFERTGGLTAWARGYSGKDANLRNSFIENTVVEGNHAWNYNTLPNPQTNPNSYPYYPGGSKTIEPWFFGSLTNEQGPPIDPAPGDGFTGAFDRFIVFRGNTVKSQGGIVVRGTSANVLVEGNTIEDSYVGIHVNYTTTQGGVVLRNNTIPPGVPDNYNPYATS